MRLMQNVIVFKNTPENKIYALVRQNIRSWNTIYSAMQNYEISNLPNLILFDLGVG